MAEENPNWPSHVAFHFRLAMETEYIPFREVSGVNTELELETIREGGRNEFEHKLPRQIRHENLICKGAVLPLDSELIWWVKKVLENDFTLLIERRNLIVSLLGEDGEPIYNWTCKDAFPVKWNVDPFHSEKNELAIESLEFAYTCLRRS